MEDKLYKCVEKVENNQIFLHLPIANPFHSPYPKMRFVSLKRPENPDSKNVLLCQNDIIGEYELLHAQRNIPKKEFSIDCYKLPLSPAPPPPIENKPGLAQINIEAIPNSKPQELMNELNSNLQQDFMCEFEQNFLQRNHKKEPPNYSNPPKKQYNKLCVVTPGYVEFSIELHKEYNIDTAIGVLSPCKHETLIKSTRKCMICLKIVEKGFEEKYAIFDYGLSKEEALHQSVSLGKKWISEKKLILVLDLDNTLIHSFECDKALCFPPLDPDISILNITETKFYCIKLRPYSIDFFQQTYKNFEIFIYTAAVKSYAFAVIALFNAELEKKGIPFQISQKNVIARENISAPEIKKLSIIFPGNENITLIIDDRGRKV